MVTYAEFIQFSNVPCEETDFSMIENRAVDVLSMLCGSTWNEQSEICKKAVLYQIETILLNGGLDKWYSGNGAKGVSGYSYNIGAESESYTYMVKGESENGKAFNGLAINPMAWQLLVNAKILNLVKGVRVW